MSRMKKENIWQDQFLLFAYKMEYEYITNLNRRLIIKNKVKNLK